MAKYKAVGNPCRHIFDDYFTAFAKEEIEGWWSKKNEEPKFANDLYHVIKSAERMLGKDDPHVEQVWTLLRVLNEMEGR